jgi:hypothetical protein
VIFSLFAGGEYLCGVGAEEELKTVNPKSLVGDENKASPITVHPSSTVTTSDKVEASSWNHAGKFTVNFNSLDRLMLFTWFFRNLGRKRFYRNGEK